MIRFTKSLHYVILITAFLGSAYSQTPISGSLSGILPVDEYLVTGDIFVDNNDSLLIQPGTDFLIQPGLNFTIQGHLQAIGTEDQHIRFKRADEYMSWGHIVFDYGSSNYSFMDYCEVEGGYSVGGWPYNCGGGILIYGNTATISNCIISANKASYCGGGMAFYCGGDATVINCLIMGNITGDDGGGVEVYGAAPHFINTTFQYNDASSSYGVGGGLASGEGGMSTFDNCSFIENRGIWGGGYYCDRSEDVVFNDCIFDGNMAELSGGGLFFYEEGWGAEFNRCLIINNTAGQTGGGFYSAVSPHTIENCNFIGNSSNEGSALYAAGTNAQIKNCIFENNTGSASIHFDYIFYGEITYSDFYNNPLGSFSGIIPEQLGIITGINSNGTPCDNYMNIFEDPLFVDPVNGDYHLTINSECIDAGDPASPLDPDGTTADMGVFYFDQSIPQISILPENPPILIPASGGSFEYSVSINNIWMNPVQFDFWTEAIMPDGSTYGPILLRRNLNLAQYDSLTRSGITQSVPANAPSGMYSYVANVGIYPNEVSNFDQFEFEKSTTIDGSTQVGNWGITGWDGISEITRSSPSGFTLYPPCPNPFNPSTTISYTLESACYIDLTVYDNIGREVAKLVEGYASAGNHEVVFDAKNLVSGVYFAKLRTGNHTNIQKMLLVK